jgi:hypothetical protein
MRRSYCTLRKTAVVFIACMSVVFALYLVWHLITPDQIGRVASASLLAVLALLVLPAATAAVWELDRRAAQRVVAMEDEPALPLVQAPERRVHDGPSASVPSHRRRVDGAGRARRAR